jgi:osmotically-inducible protein OsmY
VRERIAMLSGGDRAIAARVAQAVRAVPGVPSKAISVESWRGHVTLRGELPSKDLASAAAQAAKAVRGVVQIDNFLRTP